jgi:hypothetical protein
MTEFRRDMTCWITSYSLPLKDDSRPTSTWLGPVWYVGHLQKSSLFSKRPSGSKGRSTITFVGGQGISESRSIRVPLNHSELCLNRLSQKQRTRRPNRTRYHIIVRARPRVYCTTFIHNLLALYLTTQHASIHNSLSV